MAGKKTEIGLFKLGFLNLLTLIFIILKLTGYADWSWWLVLLPTIISVGLGFLFLIMFFVLVLAVLLSKLK